ncbi:MAG: DUF2235 domain-containing protein [Stenotrophobium sp.]
MKRLVICCDGTWNTPDETDDGIPCPTNVVKIAQSVKDAADNGTAQQMFYDPGIGTSGGLLQRAFDAMTGVGVSRNICDAYRYLVTHYDPGDELFFFGFSRGAFTVRSLAGLVRKCGILRRNAADRVDQAYKLYRSSDPASHPREIEATLFRRTYAVADWSPIKFIGVWDTVGALGNPLLFNGGYIWRDDFRFHDTDLSSLVENAYQALAIDEKRRKFGATLWHQLAQTVGQRLEQVWFAGVHSNIGGGYPSTAMSDIALDWMGGKARDCGLALDAIPSKPDALAPLNESWSGIYKLLPPYYRPIAQPDPQKGATLESLHPSVKERYARDPSYRPPNLEDYFKRFPQERP